MRREKISQIINQIHTEYISEALELEAAISSKKKNKGIVFYKKYRFAVCICVVILAAMLSFTTAFATNELFRETIIRIFYPLYTSDEIKELDNGHRTGSFDITDTLLTFLNKFNKEKMELGISAKNENGYTHTLIHNTSNVKDVENIMDSVYAIVESNNPDYKILVTMQQISHKETTGTWQVTAYQIITAEKADELLAKMPLYTPFDYKENVSSETNGDPADTTIKAKGVCGVIYNANEKENIATLTAKESKQLKKVFAKYPFSDNISIQNLPDMVIKFENITYIFSQDGEVLVKDTLSCTCSQVMLTPDDCKLLLDLFKSYGIRVSSEK